MAAFRGLDRWEGEWVERVVPAGPPPAALLLVSRAADGSRLWFAVAALMALRPGLRPAAGEAVAAALLAAGAAQMLNRLVGRPRPAADHPVRRALARQPVTPSFPSSHTAVGVAFTTAVARRHSGLAFALAPLAGTLAYGRVRLRVHRPTDVLGGAVLGLAAAGRASWLICSAHDRCLRAAAVGDRRSRAPGAAVTTLTTHGWRSPGAVRVMPALPPRPGSGAARPAPGTGRSR